MGQKFYAVKKGRETGIFYSWTDCELQVKGFQGAIFQGFKTKEAATDFLEGKTPVKEKSKSSDKKADVLTVSEELALTKKYSEMEDCIVVYTDGSVSIEEIDGVENIRYSYGFLIVDNNQIVHEDCGEGFNKEASVLRNVAGELSAVMKGLLCVKEKYPNKKMYVFHDYHGVSAWVLGSWKAKNPLVKQYVEFMKKSESHVSFEFVEVTGHKGNKFNVRADKLARQALGLS